MRVVIQRAKNAKCTVEGQVTGQIDHGYCLFVRIDTESQGKIGVMRLFWRLEKELE